MKRTISLIGILLAGVIVVFSPVAGLFEPALSADAAPETTAATTTNAAPGPDPATETWVAPDATTDESTQTTTTTEDATTTEATASDTVVVTGPAVRTRFGDFQVEIVVEDGALADVITLDEPGDRRSQNINDQAIPVYEAQAIETQSADLDVMSGATVTWEAWTASLAAALDAAGLA